MAPTYKLMYFDAKALAEPIRMMFSHANVKFEDVRISREDWPNLKSKMTWNVMPVLEEDGKQLSQSLTILRYLGRKFGLAGADEFQTAKCNEYIDAVADVRTETTKLFREEDETKKTEIKKNLQTTVFPKVWKKFDEILKQNGTGFLVGKELTYADIYVAFMSEWLSAFIEFSLNEQDFSNLLAHQKKVLGLPGIKEWIANRPVTQF